MMSPENVKYRVVPSVVKADEMCTVTVRSFDGMFGFFDDTEYKVQFIPMEESDVPMDESMCFDSNRKLFTVMPKNGELKLAYRFTGEQEWFIHIWCEDYSKHQNPLYEGYAEHWTSLIDMPKKGIWLSVYSLLPDLYHRKVLKGDLHIHTSASDGNESPEIVAAYYRRSGYDFIAITDHNLYNTSQEISEKLKTVSNMEIMKAEEVHNDYAGYIHMVNIGSSYSINDIYLNQPQRIEREIAELEAAWPIPEGVDKREYLNRVWLYKEIKKSGGYAIYPHPFWVAGHHYHVETKTSRAILKNGLFDAFEILGGCTPEGNNLQVALYNDLRAEGLKMPIVGSTDSHSVLAKSTDTHFRRASTVVFADENGVLPAISSFYSTAVESVDGENQRVFGAFRLIKYTHFLLRRFFPLHDELCRVSSSFILDYVCGNEELKELVRKAESRIDDFSDEFFGRKI